jgi:acetyl esterase/lipase
MVQTPTMIEMTRSYPYKVTPQARLFLHAYLPDGWRASDTRASIVFFFGGGWAKGHAKHFARQAAYLASRGMVALCADYRVSSRHSVLVDQCVEDAKSAIRWVRSHHGILGIDPERITGAGGSAGGHIAACAAMVDGFEAAGDDLSVSSAPNALILFNAVLDLTIPPVELARRMSHVVHPHLQSAVDMPALARALSPAYFVRPGLPPTILFQGERDRIAPADRARAFVSQMREAGNRAEIMVAPDMPHGFFNRSPWFERTLYRADEFLASLDSIRGGPTFRAP